MPDAYHIALAACLAASLCWLAVLLRVWIRMRDELRRERDLFRDAHVTTCRQLREAIQDGQAARAELRKLLERAIAGQSSGQSGWIPVGERLPTESTWGDGDVIVVARTGDCEPWTDRAYLSDGRWHWAVGGKPVPSGIRLTHWMPVPEPPGCEGAPPVLAAQPGPWVRVADALPDDRDEEVVALAGGQPVLAHYSPSGGWHDCYWRDLSGVTHWARWPEEDESGGAGKEGSADA